MSRKIGTARVHSPSSLAKPLSSVANTSPIRCRGELPLDRAPAETSSSLARAGAREESDVDSGRSSRPLALRAIAAA